MSFGTSWRKEYDGEFLSAHKYSSITDRKPTLSIISQINFQQAESTKHRRHLRYILQVLVRISYTVSLIVYKFNNNNAPNTSIPRNSHVSHFFKPNHHHFQQFSNKFTIFIHLHHQRNIQLPNTQHKFTNIIQHNHWIDHIPLAIFLYLPM